MADWPISDNNLIFGFGHNLATSGNQNVASSASANTKGAWQEVCSSLTRKITGLLIRGVETTASREFLFDIGIGAEGSEVVLLANMNISTDTIRVWGQNFYLPVSIAEGTRVSFRCQASTGSSSINLSFSGFVGGYLTPAPLGVIDTYGANTADSGGTSIDPGGSANTKGAYVELTSSTLRPISYIIINVGNQLNSARVLAPWFIDVAVGAEGSELDVIPNHYVRSAGATYIPFPQISIPYPVRIPTGTRLSVRAQTTPTDATDRLIDVILIGIC